MMSKRKKRNSKDEKKNSKKTSKPSKQYEPQKKNRGGERKEGVLFGFSKSNHREDFRETFHHPRRSGAERSHREDKRSHRGYRRECSSLGRKESRTLCREKSPSRNIPRKRGGGRMESKNDNGCCCFCAELLRRTEEAYRMGRSKLTPKRYPKAEHFHFTRPIGRESRGVKKGTRRPLSREPQRFEME